MERSSRSRFATRITQDTDAVRAAQRLRCAVFYGRDGLDEDQFDPLCEHLLINDTATGDLVGTLRFRVFEDGSCLAQSYSAQWYDLSRLNAYPAPVLELGRFCTHPSCQSADVLRLALASLGQVVKSQGINLMIGCSSFVGTDPSPYRDAFSLLKSEHSAPMCWRPDQSAVDVVEFQSQGYTGAFDRQQARASLPPLLRTYLTMGGWVSDHAVVDHCLQTLHVFTAVEIARIPARRARTLRALSE